MGYLDTWKVLEGIMAEFREKSMIVPSEVMEDLKSARTTIRMIKSGANNEEVIQKLAQYLINVESYLVSEGEKTFSAKHVDEWLKRLGEASRKIDEEGEEETRFVPGIPREQKWIRVKPSAELPVDKLRALIADSTLYYKTQPDDSLLVYGKHDQIKTFVEKMTAKYKLASEERKEGHCR
ncbi:hypothetical protein A3K79_06225 [Candidatus Bathyarchaeota archaeon RBG_13_46_16b]|nr:MAG: hypothetical protein A3K79_06225 [Candidatus Bathyarchaeota archaeon RBG_13_46_16b]